MSRAFNQALLQALGLDGSLVQELTVHAKAGQPTYVCTTGLVNFMKPEALQRRFKVVELDEPQPLDLDAMADAAMARVQQTINRAAKVAAHHTALDFEAARNRLLWYSGWWAGMDFGAGDDKTAFWVYEPANRWGKSHQVQTLRGLLQWRDAHRDAEDEGFSRKVSRSVRQAGVLTWLAVTLLALALGAAHYLDTCPASSLPSEFRHADQ